MTFDLCVLIHSQMVCLDIRLGRVWFSALEELWPLSLLVLHVAQPTPSNLSLSSWWIHRSCFFLVVFFQTFLNFGSSLEIWGFAHGDNVTTIAKLPIYITLKNFPHMHYSFIYIQIVGDNISFKLVKWLYNLLYGFVKPHHNFSFPKHMIHHHGHYSSNTFS